MAGQSSEIGWAPHPRRGPVNDFQATLGVSSDSSRTKLTVNFKGLPSAPDQPVRQGRA